MAINISNDRKIIPLWQVAVKFGDLEQLQCIFDHGGVGVDVKPRITQNDQVFFDIVTIKEQCNVSYLGSKTFSLPFLEPNKVSKLQDPCLGEIIREKKDRANFYPKIRARISQFNNFPNGTLHTAVTNIFLKLSGNADLKTITLPKYILELARIYHAHPIPRANWLYTGNCLAVTPEKVLIHPVGKSLNKLGMTPLFEAKSEDSCSQFFKPGTLQELKLNGGPIYQISFQEVMNRDLCLIRKKHMVHILTVQLKEDMASIDVCSVCNKKSDEVLCSASLSSHVPGEYATVSTDGHLQLHTFTKSDPIWQCQQSVSPCASMEKSNNDLYWGCGFGSHPRSLLTLNRNAFSIADLRTKGKTMELLAKDSASLFSDEELFLFQQSHSSYFQHYIASSHHLLVVDERFPKQVVQMWKHQLTSFPFYLSQCGHISFDDSQSQDQFILLAGQKQQETVCFEVRPTGLQPVSLAPPRYCSAPRDAFRIFQLYGLPVPESVMKRVEFPLMGVCSIPYSKGITVLQMISTGDTFYQDLVHEGVQSEDERTHRYGGGYAVKSPKLEYKNVESWISKADLPAEENRVQSDLEWCDPASLKEKLLVKRPVSKKCAFCVPRQDQIVLETQDCPSCGLSSETSWKIINAKRKGGLLVKGNPLNYQSLDLQVRLKKEYDPFSEKLLKVWDVRKTLDATETLDEPSEGDILRSYLIPEETSPDENLKDTRKLEGKPLEETFESSSTLEKRMKLSINHSAAKSCDINSNNITEQLVESMWIIPTKSSSIQQDLSKMNYQDSSNFGSQNVANSSDFLKGDMNLKTNTTVSVETLEQEFYCEPSSGPSKWPTSQDVHLSDCEDDDCIPPTPVKNVNKFTPMRLSLTRKKTSRTDGF